MTTTPVLIITLYVNIDSKLMSALATKNFRRLLTLVYALFDHDLYGGVGSHGFQVKFGSLGRQSGIVQHLRSEREYILNNVKLRVRRA